MIGVLLQGVTNRCLGAGGVLAKDDDGADDNGNEVMLMIIVGDIRDNTFQQLP